MLCLHLKKVWVRRKSKKDHWEYQCTRCGKTFDYQGWQFWDVEDSKEVPKPNRLTENLTMDTIGHNNMLRQKYMYDLLDTNDIEEYELGLKKREEYRGKEEYYNILKLIYTGHPYDATLENKHLKFVKKRTLIQYLVKRYPHLSEFDFENMTMKELEENILKLGGLRR